MKFTINDKSFYFDESKTLRFEGRDVILVHCEDGWKQGFYRSSGRNSGKEGRWFPFDGYVEKIHWFDKGRFCLYGQKYTELERYGYQILKEVGDYLCGLEIGAGKEVGGDEVNKMVAPTREDMLAQPYCPYWLKGDEATALQMEELCIQHSKK
jgi:hypothetical protein